MTASGWETVRAVSVPAGQFGGRLTKLRRDGGDVDQADHPIVPGGRLGDDHAAIGMPGQHNAAAQCGDDVPEVSGVTVDTAQRVGHCDDVARMSLQSGDNLVPACGFGKRTVHEHDGRSTVDHVDPPR